MFVNFVELKVITNITTIIINNTHFFNISKYLKYNNVCVQYLI